MRLTSQAVAAVILGLLLAPAVVRADLEGARKYVDQATEKVKSGDFKAAQGTLDLAEAELDGVSAADAAPIKQQIDALKKQIAGAGNAQQKQQLTREIENALKSIQRSIEEERFLQADSDAKSLYEALNSDENKAILGDD